jgi:transcription elongation GreA/GreB family factor
MARISDWSAPRLGKCLRTGYAPRVSFNKRKVVEEIQNHLAEELAGLLPAAEAAEKANRELPVDQAERVRAIQQQLTMYRFLPMREFNSEDVVCPSSLVELEISGRRAFYFLVPSGGGLVMKIEGNPVQVITPNSPLGEALLGRKVGDQVQVQAAGSARAYRIVSQT